MKGDDLPEMDHVVRYVKPSMILEDGIVDGSEFCLRATRPDETGVSVNWLEAFGDKRVRQLGEVRRLFRLDVRPSGRFAELKVETILLAVAEKIDTLRLVHDPLDADNGFDADPSHAEIIGLPPGESERAALVGEMIAECVIDMHLAIEGRGD